MTFDDFMTKLFILYPKDKRTAIAWVDAYRKVLNDEDIDFDALYDKMITTFAGSSAPSPAWCKSNSRLKKQAFKEAMDDINFESVYCDRNGFTYCAGVDPDLGWNETVRRLSKQGFKNFRAVADYLATFKSNGVR